MFRPSLCGPNTLSLCHSNFKKDLTDACEILKNYGNLALVIVVIVSKFIVNSVNKTKGDYNILEYVR